MFFTPVSEIANTDIALLDDSQTVSDAVRLMEKEAKHALVITGQKGLRVVSTHILISLRFAGFDFSTPLSQVGLPLVETLKWDQVLAEAAVTYSRANSELLCVVDDDETLIGVITSSDIIHYMMAYAPDIECSLKDLKAIKDFVCVDEHDPLKMAVLKMQTAGHTSVLVEREGVIAGIVSNSDIFPILSQKGNLWEQPVHTFMSSPIRTVSLDSSFKAAITLFNSSKLRRLGVSDSEGVVIGLIHQREVIAKVYDLMREERRQQQILRELSDSEQRWRAVLEGTGQGVWDWNAQTNKVYFSPVWKSMLGYEEDEIGDTLSEWESRIHPDDIEGAYRDVEAHLSGETPIYDNTHRVRSKDGSYKWIRDTGKVFSRDAEGKPLRVIGSHTDITAEFELKNKLSLLADNMPGMLYQYRFDSDGSASFPFATQGIEDIYGCSPEKAIEDADFVLRHIHPEDIEAVSTSIMQSAKDLMVWEQEYRYLHPTKGERWLEGRATPTRMSDGSVIWNGYIYDITDRKEQELALKKAQQVADEANKAKSSFLANMSHEIRTPMSGIIGLSQISQGEQNLDVLQERLYKIHRSGKLLLGILNDILDYSKIESGKLGIEEQPFFLEGMLDNLSSLFALQAEKKSLALVFDTAPDLARVYMGDELRIRQILTNLLGNAIKFTERGRVRLTVRLGSTQTLGNSTRHWLQFSIEDTGIGITPEQQEKLFCAFSQADTSIARKHGGSGLGLVISQRLVDAMEGQGIDLVSEADKGSRFSFQLPLAICSDAQAQTLMLLQQEDESVADHLHGEILLVEDNLINQEITRTQLEQLGLKVTLAEDGLQALDLLDQRSFDLVLMDIQMPVMDGYTATRQLREKGLQVPVIALTAAAMAEDQKKALEAGMNGHLTKPIETHALFRTLNQWLSGVGDSAQVKAESHAATDSAGLSYESPPTTSVSDQTPLFDPEEGIAMVGGQEALYRKVLQEFLRQLKEEYLQELTFVAQLTEISSADDFIRGHRVAHSIKGVAGNLCMQPLAQSAAQLDQLLKQEQPPSDEMLKNFRQLLDRTDEDVSDWLVKEIEKTAPTRSVDSSSESDLSKPGVGALTAQLELLMGKIRNSQFIDEDELTAISADLSAAGPASADAEVLWQSVTDALDQFDFEQAAAALQQLSDQLNNPS